MPLRNVKVVVPADVLTILTKAPAGITPSKTSVDACTEFNAIANVTVLELPTVLTVTHVDPELALYCNAIVPLAELPIVAVQAIEML